MKMYKLLGVDGKEYLSETPGTFGGNGRLKIYGRLDCPSALSTIRRFPGTYEKRLFVCDSGRKATATPVIMPIAAVSIFDWEVEPSNLSQPIVG